MTESDPNYPDQPDFVRQFRASYVDEATGRFGEGMHASHLLVETRYAANEEVEIFTVYQGVEHRARSINELVSRLPGLKELRIPRSVPIEASGKETTGMFIEIHRPSMTSNSFESTVKVVLEIESESWESPWTDFLSDALNELHRIALPWRFRTCISCAMAGHPTPYGNDDQLLWCYRDAPLALAEYAQSKRFAGGLNAFAGHYWVRGFHRCSAWRPRGIPT
jgi:hypothetical protein